MLKTFRLATVKRSVRYSDRPPWQIFAFLRHSSSPIRGSPSGAFCLRRILNSSTECLCGFPWELCLSTVSVGQNNEGRLSHLLNASERLGTTRSVDEVVAVLRDTARAAVGSEGIAIVIEDEGRCSYVAEDADSPLWQGQTFKADHCISAG